MGKQNWDFRSEPIPIAAVGNPKPTATIQLNLVEELNDEEFENRRIMKNINIEKCRIAKMLLSHHSQDQGKR